MFATACGSNGSAPAEPTTATAPKTTGAVQNPTPASTTPGTEEATPEPSTILSPPLEPRTPLFADGTEIPPAPSVPIGPLDASVIADLDIVFSTLLSGVDIEALDRVGASGDARVAWLMADLLRFFQQGPVSDAAVLAFESLTGVTLQSGFVWGSVTDHLIAWDLPAPPGYVQWKRVPFEIIEPSWEPFFSDTDADIDYRFLSWGGVRIDDRPIEMVAFACPEGCIPALDDPEVTDASNGDWYDDNRLVFGVVVNGKARAYPKHMMEVHEMINDTLGGRRIGIPYCTLCGSAQAYFTDVVPDGFETIELRTSGLLTRSNKVMYDLHTSSVFDTFLGTALSGPLQDEGYELEMISVVTSTWGDWKGAHPDTTIIAQDGGIRRFYTLDPLGGRDDAGPIFPIGDVDPRLPVQEQVLGVVTPDGVPVAFAVAQARAAIDAGTDVTLAGVRLVVDGGGLRAELEDGTPIASHQSFWFAWSQFQPETLVWTPFS